MKTTAEDFYSLASIKGQETDLCEGFVDVSASITGHPGTILAVSLENKNQIGFQRAEARFVEASSSILMLVLLNRTQETDAVNDRFRKTLWILQRSGVVESREVISCLK